MQWHGFRSVVRNAGVQGPKKQRQQLGPDYLKTALGRGAPAQLEPRAGKALGRSQSVGSSKWILTRAWKYRYLQMSVSFQCLRTEWDSAQHTGVRVPYCVKLAQAETDKTFAVKQVQVHPLFIFLSRASLSVVPAGEIECCRPSEQLGNHAYHLLSYCPSAPKPQDKPGQDAIPVTGWLRAQPLSASDLPSCLLSHSPVNGIDHGDDPEGVVSTGHVLAVEC